MRKTSSVYIGTGLKLIRHDRTGHRPVPTDKKHSLSEMIRGFKTFSSKKINKINPNIDFHWQRSFYDRVIRSQKELENIRHYIYYNPTNWAQDGNNPINFKK